MRDKATTVTFEDVNEHRGNHLMLMLFAYESTKDILSLNGYKVLRFIQEIESGRFLEVAFDHRMEYRDLLEKRWEVALHSRELEKWDGGTARSRDFMRNHSGKIWLSWLVGFYQKKALSLHDWLVKIIHGVLGKHFPRVRRLKRQVQ